MTIPATIRISAKCSDMFYASLHDAEGRELGEMDDYVPKWMPGEHFGDYVQLHIDLKTGKILNWREPTIGELETSFRRIPG